jgi:anti-sigma factor ChrR (cupin superfamily)
MNTRPLAQVLADGIEATTNGITDQYTSPNMRVDGLIDIAALAAYIRAAYTLTDVDQYGYVEQGGILQDNEGDTISRDEDGWYLLNDLTSLEEHELVARAFLLPWRWEGHGENAEAVDVLTPGEGRQ